MASSMVRAGSRQAGRRLLATLANEAGRLDTPVSRGDGGSSGSQLARERIERVERLKGSVSPFLHDSFGRPHDYLRISLTEKCNLRCTYCMPENGVPLLPKDDLLSADEIDRLARLFVDAGVTKIRLTGGEPTIRRDLPDIVSRLGKLGLDTLGLTSNGIALHRKLEHLVQNGLTSANISLDTLDPFKFELMTRRRGLSAVHNSIDAALALKRRGTPFDLKINVVVVNGLNDNEVLDFVQLTRDKDLTVRFIEYMPFEENRWSTAKLLPSSQLVDRIRTRLPLEKLYDDKHDTSKSWQVPGYKGKIGFISSMTDHFCGGCSRLRISADGNMKVCLFGPPVLSLRPMLRSGQSDQTILEAIGGTLYAKKKWAHDGLGSPTGIAKNGVNSLLRNTPWLANAHHPQTTLRAFSTTTRAKQNKLSHLNEKGEPTMVDVGDKQHTQRTATAIGRIYIGPLAFRLATGAVSADESSKKAFEKAKRKGDVLLTSRLAGIMGAKQTSALIPLCHPVPLTSVNVELVPLEADHSIEIRATAKCDGQTGVEMEALMAVNVAALTVWDMCKAVAGQEMVISDIRVTSKSGGKSGDWQRA